MAKEKNPTTPVAPCLWPFLNKPDTRWKQEGVYRVSLVFDENDEFVQKVEKAAEYHFNEKKKSMKPKEAAGLKFQSPVKQEIDEDGKPTGNVLIEFKSYATFKDKKTGEVKPLKLKAFDAAGVEIKGAMPQIGNGSKLSIAFNAKPTIASGKFFLSLYINAFQLVELVEFKKDGSSYGFGKQDGGYTSHAGAEDNPFNSDAGESDPGDDDDVPF